MTDNEFNRLMQELRAVRESVEGIHRYLPGDQPLVTKDVCRDHRDSLRSEVSTTVKYLWISVGGACSLALALFGYLLLSR